MSIWPRAFTTCGALLTAVLAFTAYAAAPTSVPRLKTLYSFTGGSDGYLINSGVVIGKGGVLYGTASGGGTGWCDGGLFCGTVLSLTPPKSTGAAWTGTVLYTFADSDGVSPGALVIGSGGVLYGTTWVGGTTGQGTVFSLKPPASSGGTWTEGVLHNFTGSDGAYPFGPRMEIGKGGVLYGTAYMGGTGGVGTVFSLTPPTSPGAPWTETVLHNFTGRDGSEPVAGVTLGKGGVLYGTTFYGGTSGHGTVFRLRPPVSPGGAWKETVLHNFTGNDGANPGAGVVVDSSGVLYGTTDNGGAANNGTVFSLTPSASSGAWTEAVLYAFTGGSDGAAPHASVVIGGGGVLYGTTLGGGTSTACNGYSCGTVFELTPPASPGGAWTETALHSFSRSDGAHPQADVAIGAGGVLYGTTSDGGIVNSSCPQGCGTVFMLKP